MSSGATPIAENMKKMRKKQQLSQEELSRLADVSYNTIIKIEAGATQNPTIKSAQKIAEALGVTVDELINKN